MRHPARKGHRLASRVLLVRGLRSGRATTGAHPKFLYIGPSDHSQMRNGLLDAGHDALMMSTTAWWFVSCAGAGR